MNTAIDLFAGSGGWTCGASAAGVKVIWAANHLPLAVATHKANHPHVKHSCQDLMQANFTAIPSHDIMLASPSCTGHTNAKGKEQPHHDAARNTAWAVIQCAEVHREPLIIIENVPKFQKWVLYPAWCEALKLLGYSLAPYVVDAADHGVPQNRERLFIIATRTRAPIKIKLPQRDHVPATNIIEWDNYRWSRINKPGRSKNTLRQIKNARRQGYGDCFVIPYYTSGSGETGRSIDRPIGTITTVDRWAIIKGNHMRMFQPQECRVAMGFPDHYILPKKKRDAVFLLGNAVSPPVGTDILNAVMEAA